MRTKQLSFLLAGLVVLLCSPLIARAGAEHGEYLVTILGCGGCHTQGVIVNQPNGEWLAGSTIGIAYTDAEVGSPGIVFPSNLTPDEKTGLGGWTRADIVRAIKRGVSHAGNPVSSVMPWTNYSRLSKQDSFDIADYLLSLQAVKKQIPENIEPGSEREASYIRIGIYIFSDGKLSDIAPLPER